MTTFTNFTEEMTTKKATVKISQKNKFLRDQKEVLFLSLSLFFSMVDLQQCAFEYRNMRYYFSELILYL